MLKALTSTASRALIGRVVARVYPGVSPRTMVQRGRLASRLARYDLSMFSKAPAGSAAALLMDGRPEVLGLAYWPFISAAWGPDERMSALQTHLAQADALGFPYVFPVPGQIEIADLDFAFAGLRVVLDQPRWFMREGSITVNAFVGDRRIYSVAFCFGEENGARVMLIGGIQGRSFEGANDLYRDITKALHGLRPRDMIIDVARGVATHAGCTALYGVVDKDRHHNHSYFRTETSTKERDTADYDEIWADRGAAPSSRPGFMRLSVEPNRRPLSEIKPKKRSLYKKRYALIEEMEAALQHGLANPLVVQFKDL